MVTKMSDYLYSIARSRSLSLVQQACALRSDTYDLVDFVLSFTIINYVNLTPTRYVNVMYKNHTF